MFGMDGFGSMGDLMAIHELQKENVLTQLTNRPFYEDEDLDEDILPLAFHKAGVNMSEFTKDEIEQIKEEYLTWYEDRFN